MLHKIKVGGCFCPFHLQQNSNFTLKDIRPKPAIAVTIFYILYRNALIRTLFDFGTRVLLQEMPIKVIKSLSQPKSTHKTQISRKRTFNDFPKTETVHMREKPGMRRHIFFRNNSILKTRDNTN